MDLFEAVNTLVPIRALVERCGLEITGDKISCPWHTEKELSCHICDDSNRLYCYGAECQRHYSPIDLMMSCEGTASSFEAALELAEAFNIDYTPADTEEQQRCLELQQEREAIHELLTAAAEIYHAQLQPEHYRVFEQKWGLTKQTVERFVFGYAPRTAGGKYIEKKLIERGFEPALIGRSGLLNQGGYDHFTDRIIFPYWSGGQVVYFIGRRLEKSVGSEGKGEPKFIKLLVHSDKNPHVSEAVTNCYFLGEDTVRQGDELIIAEGVADTYAAIQAGFACLSPVTTQVRKEDLDRLTVLARRAEVVYVCFDTEGSGAGEEAALWLAEHLQAEGIEAKIIQLPGMEDNTDENGPR